MAFVTLPGVKGKVYVPEDNADQPKKHACKDCFSCQMCSDDRCHLCLNQKSCREKNTGLIRIKATSPDHSTGGITDTKAGK